MLLFCSWNSINFAFQSVGNGQQGPWGGSTKVTSRWCPRLCWQQPEQDHWASVMLAVMNYFMHTLSLEFIYFAIKIIATAWASCPMGVWVIPHVPRITGAGPASHRRCHVHPVTSPDWTVLYHGIVNMDGLMLSLYIRHHLVIGWLRSTISCSWNQKTTCQQIH